MHPRRVLLVPFAAAALAAPSLTQSPALVRDINATGGTDPGASIRQSAATLGIETYFFATPSPLVGSELHRTSGAPGTTRMVVELNPGPGDGWAGTDRIVAYRGEVYFAGDDCGSFGAELWKSDGSAAGTRVVADIAAGSAGADVRELTVAAGTLYFVARRPDLGAELC